MAWPPWSDAAPATLAQYVLPGEVKRLFPDGLPGPTGRDHVDQLSEVYDAFLKHEIRYAHEAPLSDPSLQLIRPPDEVLWAPRHATCLDLAVVFAGACLVAGLHPWIVIADAGGVRHAAVAVWVGGGWREGADDAYPFEGDGVWPTLPAEVASELRESVSGSGDFVLVDPTAATTHNPGGVVSRFESSVASAASRLLDRTWSWVVGVDIGLRWRAVGTLPAPAAPASVPLREPYLDPDLSDAGPLDLIRPEFGQIPFQPRDELHALLNWCNDPEPFPGVQIAVVYGAGGAGKTHLLSELLYRLDNERGWLTGLYPTTAPDPSWLGRVVSPLLIGVDYADARVNDAIALLGALKPRATGPTWVVLTARSLSGWWEQLEEALRAEGQSYSVRARLALERRPENYRRIYAQARRSLATRPPTAAELIAPPRHPSWTTLDYVLLAWHDARTDDPLPNTRIELYDHVLKHEARYWQRRLATHRGCEVHQISGRDRRLLVRVAAAVSLLNPEPDRLSAVIDAVDDLKHDRNLAGEVEDVLVTCLGRTPGEPIAIRPDPVGDYLVVTALEKDIPLYLELLAGAGAQERLNAMTNLTRASVDDLAAVHTLLAHGLERTDDLWPAALQVASTLGGPLPNLLRDFVSVAHPRFPFKQLADALPSSGNLPTRALAVTLAERAVAEARTPGERAQALQDLAVAQSKVGARPEALESISQAVAHYRGADQNEVSHNVLASALDVLSTMQSEMGDHPAALSSSLEAVEHSRRLARDDLRSLPRLAGALANLANRYSAVGNHGAALGAISEAGGYFRTLNQVRHPAFLPELGSALTNLAAVLSSLGQPTAALNAMTEACDVKRALARARPAAFLPDLADALSNMSAMQLDAGEARAAFASASDAVTRHRSLVRTNPMAFLPDLAMSLNNLGNAVAAMGNLDAALDAFGETVRIRRHLVETNAGAFTPGLARSLSNLARVQSDAGSHRAALATITEAVELHRTLVHNNEAAFLADLASSLVSLSSKQAALGERNAALSSITEAVTHFRRLADRTSPALLRRLADALSALSARQYESGQHQDALRSIDEAVAHFRTLADADPAPFLPNLASSLSNLATIQSAGGDRAGALASSSEAVRHYRAIAEAGEAGFTSALATTLNNHAAHHSAMGNRDAALAASAEAVERARELARINRGAHRPDLGAALTNRAFTQSAVGDHHAALGSADEAVAVLRELVAEDSGLFLPNLAHALVILTSVQEAVGATVDAVASATEAVTHYRGLLKTGGARHLPHLAMALNNLAKRQDAVSDHETALGLTKEAIGHYRTLATDNPSAYRAELASMLNNLAVMQSEGGDARGGLESITEAQELYRELATTNPSAFLAGLAGSLNTLSNIQARAGEHDAALTSIAEAVTHLRALSRAHPAAFIGDLAPALMNFMEALETSGRHDDAQRELDATVEMLPAGAGAEVLTWLASHLHRRGRRDDAGRILRQAIALLAEERDDRRLGPARRAIRRSVIEDGIATADGEEALPRWAGMRLESDDLGLFHAWAATGTDWSQEEQLIREHAARLLSDEFAESLEMVAFIEPENPFVDYMTRNTRAMREQGLEVVLELRRGGHAVQRVVLEWIATKTWNDSFAYAREHLDSVTSEQAVTRLRESARGNADIAQHYGIALLLREHPVDDVFAMVTDIETTIEHVNDALESGERMPLSLLLLGAPNITDHPFYGELLNAALRVHDGAVGEAEAAIARAAQVGTATQRSAAAARLATLRRRRPEYAETINRLISVLLAPQEEAE